MKKYLSSILGYVVFFVAFVLSMNTNAIHDNTTNTRTPIINIGFISIALLYCLSIFLGYKSYKDGQKMSGFILIFMNIIILGAIITGFFAAPRYG